MTNKIEVQNVTVTFTHNGQQTQAVKEVSFTVQSGEIFGIVGLSGAGKSTVIRTLNLLQRPTSGNVLIDGQDIVQAKGKNLKQVRKKIGMIFQHFNLIQNRTVGENIEFALKATDYPKEKRAERVNELLSLVDLLDKKEMYPSNLSGGQKQRIGIARALANEPEILLCDEATSALDVETTEDILSILEKINQELGLTIVFITHELEVAKRLFHRVAVMEKGEIVELEDTFDLFAQPKATITKKLVGRYFELTVPDELMQRLTEGVLLELRYQGTKTLDPLISSISKKYALSISIIHGKIEYIREKAIGILYVYVTGDEHQVKLAIKEMEANVFKLSHLTKGAERDGVNN